MKKLFSLVLAVVLALSLAVPAIAADVEGPAGPNDIAARRPPLAHCPIQGCPGFLHPVNTEYGILWQCDTCHNFC